MGERSRQSVKKPETKIENSLSQLPETNLPHSKKSPISSFLHLQRTIGNQAVQRLFQSIAIQAKLRIGQPNGMYEQEADRVAEQVMRMPEPQMQRQPEEEEEEEEKDLIQTKPLAEQITPLVQKQAEPEEDEEEEEEEPVQTKQTGGQAPQVSPSLEAQIQSLLNTQYNTINNNIT